MVKNCFKVLKVRRKNKVNRKTKGGEMQGKICSKWEAGCEDTNLKFEPHLSLRHIWKMMSEPDMSSWVVSVSEKYSKLYLEA